MISRAIDELHIKVCRLAALHTHRVADARGDLATAPTVWIVPAHENVPLNAAVPTLTLASAHQLGL